MFSAKQTWPAEILTGWAQHLAVSGSVLRFVLSLASPSGGRLRFALGFYAMEGLDDLVDGGHARGVLGVFKSADGFDADAGPAGQVRGGQSERPAPTEDLPRQDNPRSVHRGEIARGVGLGERGLPSLFNQFAITLLGDDHEPLAGQGNRLRVGDLCHGDLLMGHFFATMRTLTSGGRIGHCSATNK